MFCTLNTFSDKPFFIDTFLLESYQRSITKDDQKLIQVPAVRHLSWRESLTVPLDVLLPSPTSPTGPSGPLDEEIRTSWSRQGTSVYTACIQCPCTSRYTALHMFPDGG